MADSMPAPAVPPAKSKRPAAAAFGREDGGFVDPKKRGPFFQKGKGISFFQSMNFLGDM